MGKSKAARITDQLGELKAEMADLALLEVQLKDKLIELGIKEAEGDLFRVTVTRTMVQRVDWATVASKLEPSHQLVKAHTTEKERVTVRVTARNGT